MTKKIISSLFFLLSGLVSAQQGNASSYSFYGIGDMKKGETVENRSVGGLGIQADSIHINLNNPAAYGYLNRSIFTAGASTSNVTVQTENQKGTSSRTSLDYFAVGLPIAKSIGLGFGILPVSSVGYDIKGTDPTRSSTGTGGVNRVYISGGVKLAKNLSIGIEGNYNFGIIQTNDYTQLNDIQFATRSKTRSDISGFGLSTGITHDFKITKKQRIYSSISYQPIANLNSKNEQHLASITINSAGTETIYREQSDPVSDTSIKLASKLSVGLGIGEQNKWFVGTEIIRQNTNVLTNRLIGSSKASYRDAMGIRLGGYYIPKYDAFSGYWNKVVFRSGIRYEDTGLLISNNAIKEYGMTFGLGLPMRNTGSNINVALEYGSRGTTTTGLVKENFFNILVSLSLSDKWFNKRKID